MILALILALTVQAASFKDGLCVATCRYEMLGDYGAWDAKRKKCACTTLVSLDDSIYALKMKPTIKKKEAPKEEPWEEYEAEEKQAPLFNWKP